MNRDLSAVVTGASSGIGRAIALSIAASGGSVCLVGRNAERLKATAEAAQPCACLVSLFQADLGLDGAVADLARHVEKSFASFNTLIHCAGAHAVGRIEDLSVDQLDLLYRMNIRMPYALTQALLPLLKARRGQIVFINSSQGLQARANAGAFAATQHALKAFADSLRQEVNADGVRIVSVYPGRTATPRIEALSQTEGQTYQPELLLQPEDIAKVVAHVLQLPRTAEVTNIEIRPLIKSY